MWKETEGKKSMQKKRRRGLLALLLGLLLARAALSQELQVREYSVSSSKLHAPLTLAVAGDLHNSFFGESQEELANAILASDADALLLVGDMADSLAELDGLRALMTALGGALPTFYVTGNHECASGEYAQIKAEVRSMGATVLEGETTDFMGIRIAGVDDPLCLYRREWQAQLAACRAKDDTFTLLLAHRPDRIADYSEGFDLVVSGHAHGGQLRIPGLLPGLFAPNQGWLPDYTSGLYPAGEGQLFVTRGLTKSAVPRLFNRPELAILHLLPEESA